MSSYINIAIKPKEKEEKIQLFSFSRNSDIYQFFWENNLSHYSSEGEYKELDKKELDSALISLQEEIMRDQKRLSLMKELKTKESFDSFDEILSWQEYVDDKVELKHSIEMIQLLLSEYSYNDVEGIYTYID